MSGPIAHVSYNPGRIPDITQPGGPGIITNPGLHTGGATVIGGATSGVLTAGYDACGVYRWDDVSSQLTDDEKDAGYVHKYKLIINGILVYIYEKEDGTLYATSKSGGFFEDGTISLESAALARGLNMAFGKITGEGLSVGNVEAFLSGLVSFARENLGTFMNIVGGGLGGLTQFMKHATIGYVVASEMQKYFNSDYNEYDMIFGFWTSFWTDTLGLDIPILPTYKGRPNDGTPLSLIDIANLIKAVAYQEHKFDSSEGINDQGFGGIMQVPYIESGDTRKYSFNSNSNMPEAARKLKFFENGTQFFDPFNNIGIGVGYLFEKLVSKSSYPYTGEHARWAPTFDEWKLCVEAYGPHNGVAAWYYYPSIKSIFLHGLSKDRNPDGSENLVDGAHLFDADDYYRNRKTRVAP
jgi:hypothetical protein